MLTLLAQTSPDIGTPKDWSQVGGLAGLVIFALFTFGGLIVLFVLYFLRNLQTSWQEDNNKRQVHFEACLKDHKTERMELVGTVEKITESFNASLAAERESRERTLALEREHREREARENRDRFRCPVIEQRG